MWRSAVGVMAAAGLALSLGGCEAASEAVASPEASSPPVRVAEVREAAERTTLRYPATVRARSRAEPAFLHAGVLAERYVERGQTVAAGEALARLHHPALAPTLTAAEGQVRELDARLTKLGRDVERARALRERSLIAEEELDRLMSEREALRQAREQALARRDEAGAQLGELMLKAPFDAEVVDLLAEPGDFVSAGQPVLRLAGRNGLELELRVPTTLARRLEAGMEVEAVAVQRDQRGLGWIADVGRSGEGLAPVIVHLEEDAPLVPGEAVRVHLAVTGGEALQVPLAAVVDPGGQAPHVLVLSDDDAVRRVPVAAGRLSGDWVTVSGALSPRDRVVTAGQGRLVEGDRVRVLP